jgi:predicted RNA-binding protein with PIN domain
MPEASTVRRGVFPGSFDPLTIAHLEVACAAVRAASLDRVDLAISRSALGKEERTVTPILERFAAIGRVAATRPWLGVMVTDAQLVHDIARGYDAVVMGADKWLQMNDPAWYESAEERDRAVAALPRVLVAPREGLVVEGPELLDVDAAVMNVSSTAARAGAHHLIVPEARRRVIVDGNNMIGTRPNGWWRDRAGATLRLVAALQECARRTGARIAVVFDGGQLADLPEGVHDGVLVAYAERKGRGAADDRIVDEVAGDADPSSLTVVTSDRALAHRVRRLGAIVERPTTLADELELDAR